MFARGKQKEKKRTEETEEEVDVREMESDQVFLPEKFERNRWIK